jgi:hypothetical protein
MNPTVYTVEITHWDDGEINVSIKGAGDSDEDRASIAHALRHAIDLVENGTVFRRENFS